MGATTVTSLDLEATPIDDATARLLIEEARRRQRRRRFLLAVALLVLAAGVSAAMIGGGATKSPASRGTGQPSPGSMPALRIEWRARVRGAVDSLTYSGGSVWITDWASGKGSLLRLNASTGRVTAIISIPQLRELSGVAGLDGRIWVTSGHFAGQHGVLYEIDPATNRIVRIIAAPGQPQAVVAADGRLWVDVFASSPELRTFDPRGGRWSAPVLTTSEQLGRPTFGFGSMWVTSFEPSSEVWRIDPKTLRARPFMQAAWASRRLASLLGPDAIAASGGSLWLEFSTATRIAKVSTRTASIERMVPISHTEGTILESGGSALWVLLQTGSSSPNVYLPTPSQPGRVALLNTRTARLGPALPLGAGQYDSFAASGRRAFIGDFGGWVIAVEER
jgi:hypothetical protein